MMLTAKDKLAFVETFDDLARNHGWDEAVEIMANSMLPPHSPPATRIIVEWFLRELWNALIWHEGDTRKAAEQVWGQVAQ